MNWLEALILGFVEGLTEYLPVSSTGHLLLTQRLMGIESSPAADAYAICIQLGAILAVVGLYYRRIGQMIQGLFGRNPTGLRLAINIVTAFIPAAILGFLLEKIIKKYLFGDEWGLWPVIAAWFVGGLAILAVSLYRKHRPYLAKNAVSLESLAPKMAVIIGISQCLAMWPGVSRSLVTIVGGIIVGLSLSAAVEFSFLLGVVTLTAATAYDGVKHGGEMLSSFGSSSIIIGLVAAWIAAALSVKWMVSYLTRHGLNLFGYYRIALAIVVASAIWLGWIKSGG